MRLFFIIIKFIRYSLIVFFVILIAWLFWQNYVPMGYFKAIQDFKNSQKFISDFYPKEKSDGNGTIEMPAYFKVRVPQHFKKARITIIYQNQSNILLDLGIRKVLFSQQCISNKNKTLIGCKMWGLQKEKYVNKSLSKRIVFNDDWQEATLDFSLKNIPLIEQNYEFMFSASDENSLEQKIKIKKIKIVFEKDPLTWQEFIQQVIH
ncbi:MAG: hypothetical protein AAB526_00855 [Patescibacteria group bacterium]